MDDYFEELKQEAEENDTGLTNDVFFTEKGTVVKTYSRYPITSFLESFTSLLNSKINYISREERMSNEIEMKKLIKELGFGAPKVLKIGDESIEFEKVSGINSFNFLKQASDDDSEEFGRKNRWFLVRVGCKGCSYEWFQTIKHTCE